MTVYVDENDYPASKFAIGVVTAWLIPRVYMDWKRSVLIWTKSYTTTNNSSQGGTNRRTTRQERLRRRRQGVEALNRGALLVTVVMTTLLLISSSLVSIYTEGLHPNMVMILGGLSRIVSSGVMFVVSLDFPQWLGVYDYVKLLDTTGGKGKKSKKPTLLSNNSNNNSQGRINLRILKFDMQWKIMGQFARIYWIMLLFSCGGPSPWWGLPINYLVGLILGFGLIALIYFGRTRLADEETNNRFLKYYAHGIMICLVIFSCVSFAFGCLFIQQVWRPSVKRLGNALLAFSAFSVSLVLAVLVHVCARKLSKRQLQEKERLRQAGEMDDEDEETYYYYNHKYPSELFDGLFLEDGDGHRTRARTVSLSQEEEDEEDEEEEYEKQDEEEEKEQDTSDSEPQSSETTATTPSQQQNQEEGTSNNSHNENRSHYDNDEDDGPSLCRLCLSKLNCCRCCCCSSDDNDNHERGCPATPRKVDPVTILIASMKWLVRFVGHGLCVYMVIVNIAATQQGNYAKKLFPSVHGILYEGQEDGPVCAYSVPFSDADTRTFPNATAALEANFTIAHCGACGQCSTWQNLELQWTTRKNLAILSNRCAKKLMWKSEQAGYEKSLECHEEEIGFDAACSDCWIHVERCAIQHCSFIVMQSWIIGHLGNFDVSPDVVTAAFCEEAICEVDFVPCSGANRRRMNIVADIDRPRTQQCDLVPESNDKWLDLFGPEDAFIGKH